MRVHGLGAALVVGLMALVVSGPAASPASGRTGDDTMPARVGRPRRVPPPLEGLGPVVRIEPDDAESFPASYDVADGLEPRTVLRVQVTGFAPFTRAIAAQCGGGEPQRCGNHVPVQFGADGVATFQYFVTDQFLGPNEPGGRCGRTAPPCSVVVRAIFGDDGGGARRGEIQAVFGDRVPPAGSISVTPARDLSLDGQTVTVGVTGYPPRVRVRAMLCAAPAARGERCGAPGPSASLVVASDGTGRARLKLEPGRVGAAGASCFRGDDCGVSVASESVFARAPVVPISFAAPPGAVYDPTRLAIGLGSALALLLVAGVLLRRTDWSPVGEAAAPEIDEVAYADLDAIIAALPPLEEESPVGR